jgi:uncharacterized repeat protein (TIGR01451 family)
MNFPPAALRPAPIHRLIAVALAVAFASAFTAALLLIADAFGLPSAEAALLTITYTCPAYPSQPTSWSSTCTIPKFNPALGTLSGVRFTTTVGMSGTIVVENLSYSLTASYAAVLTGTISTLHPSGSPVLGNGNVTASASGTLSTYDGAADFAGPSGNTHASLTSNTSSFTVTSGLSAWIGASGSATMPINSVSTFNCNVVPASNSLCGSVSETSGMITVTYLYDTPDLSVTKTHPGNFGGNFVAGADGLYTITVRNVGTGPTIGVITATDVLPAGLTFITFTNPNWTLAGQSGQVLTFTRSNALNAGSSSRIVLTVGVTNTAIGTVTNSVSVTTTRDLDASNNSDTDPTLVLAGVNLSISKTDMPDPVNAAAPLTYTLVVTNIGPSDAPSVLVTDTLPSGSTFVSASGSGWSCSQSGGVVTCSRATLNIGAVSTLTVRLNAPASGGIVTNTAVIGSAGYDFQPSDNAAAITTAVIAFSNLSITKSDGPDPVNAGTTLTYTLNVSNAGPSPASNVVVTDTLPPGAAFLNASGSGWTCNPSGGDVICTRSTLAVGAAPSLILTVSAPPDTPAVNTAAVSSDAIDTDPSDNTATASTTVRPVADLAISKLDDPDPVLAGRPLTYVVSVNNLGPNTAASVMLTDTLPASATFLGVSAPGWSSCNQAGNVVTCSLASLPAGPAPNITITVNAPGADGVFTNTASVSSVITDLVPSNNSTAITTTVAGALANLAISKSDDPDPVNIGAPLTYTLTITNAGPDIAAAVLVSDTLPAGFVLGTISAPGWTCGQASGVITCTMPSLAVGSAPNIVIRGAAPVVPGAVANVAAINSATLDPNPSNNFLSETTDVFSLAELSISQTDGPDPIGTNSLLTYTISVTNAGPNVATSVRVTDTLPANVIFGGVSAPGWSSCTEAGGVLTCTLASLPIGPAPNIVITVTTPAGGQVLTNTAYVASTLTDLNMANNVAVATTLAIPTDLKISKTDGVLNVIPGSPLTYTIVVTNAGPGASLGALVTDTLPSVITGATWTCEASSGSSCPASGSGSISATVNLPESGSVTFTVRGTVPATATGTLVNTAYVTPPAGGIDANPVDNAATDVDSLLFQTDLMVAQSDLPDPVTLGNLMRYRVTVTNTSLSNATSVIFTFTLNYVSLDFASGSCSETPGLLTCDLGALGPGASRTTSIYVFPSGAGLLSNTATVSSAEFDTVPSNNVATETTTVTGFGDLSINVTNGVDTVVVGNLVTYTIAVANAGPHIVTGATVVDNFPAALSGVTWTCAAAGGSACPASGSGNLNAVVSVTTGGSVTFTATGALSSGASGTLVNSATVTAPAGVTDANTADNSSTDTDTVVIPPSAYPYHYYLPIISR